MGNLIRLTDDVEDKLVPEGQYELRVAKAEYGPTKKGDHNMISLMLVVEGSDGDGALPINHYILVPGDNDEPRVARMRLRDLKRFLVAFGYPIGDGFDPEEHTNDLSGLTGKVRVIQEEGQDSNMYNRIRLPKVA